MSKSLAIGWGSDSICISCEESVRGLRGVCVRIDSHLHFIRCEGAVRDFLT